MKNLLTALALLISLNGFGQTKTNHRGLVLGDPTHDSTVLGVGQDTVKPVKFNTTTMAGRRLVQTDSFIFRTSDRQWDSYVISTYDGQGYVHQITSSSDSSLIGRVTLVDLDSLQAIKILLKQLNETSQKYSYATEVLDYLKLNYLATDPFFDPKKSGWQKGFRKAVKRYYKSREIHITNR